MIAVWARHDEHAALDLEDMAVPALALFRLECGVQVGRDHVFDADEAGVGERRVVEDALAHVGGEVGAVVVCFDVAAGVGGVGVEGVEVGADVFEGCEVLWVVLSR